MILSLNELEKVDESKRKLLYGSCFSISGTNNSGLTTFIDSKTNIRYPTFTQKDIVYLLALYGANISEKDTYSTNKTVAYPLTKNVTHIVLLDDLSISVKEMLSYRYPNIKCTELADLFAFLNDDTSTNVGQLLYYYYEDYSKKEKIKTMPVAYTKEQKQQIEYAKSIGIKYDPIEPKKSERKFKRNDQSLVEFINDDFSIKKQPRRIEDLSI